MRTLVSAGVVLAAVLVGSWWLARQRARLRTGLCSGCVEADHFRRWEAQFTASADGLTDVADAVWPDGDQQAGGPL